MKSADLLQDMPGRPFASRAAFARKAKLWLERKTGEHVIRATYDDGGNCRICGEAGRCPVWHLPEEAVA